jgi:cytoskeleton protein RodZ
MLRGARELYGWHIEDVAAELNLLPHVVKALEADDYKQMAGWTYVVGYLRNYARLVGINIEDAIARHKQQMPPREDGPGTMTEAAHTRREPIAIHSRWVVTAVVLGLVLAGLYAAYVNRSTDVERTNLASATRSQPALELNKEPVALDEQAETQPTITSKVPAAGETSADSAGGASAGGAVSGGNEAASGATDGTVIPAVEPVKKVQAEQSQLAATPQATAKTAATPEPPKKAVKKKSPEPTKKAVKKKTPAPTSTNKATKKKASSLATTQTNSSLNPTVANRFVETRFAVQMAAATAPAARPAASGGRQLTLRITDSSHVMVRDHNNQMLVRKYFESGKVVTVSGLPPFTLVLSYPQGVRVIYGGKEMAIPASKSGRNAKVIVGR